MGRAFLENFIPTFDSPSSNGFIGLLFKLPSASIIVFSYSAVATGIINLRVDPDSPAFNNGFGFTFFIGVISKISPSIK